MGDITFARSIPELAARLINHADLNDAFGETQEGADLRLAASVLVEFEELMSGRLAKLEAEIHGLR